MDELRTQPELLSRLKHAAGKPMSPEEIHAQRVSFVMGILPANTTLTRDKVDELVAAQEGKKTAA